MSDRLERTISIRAEDNTRSTFNSIRQSANQMFEEILQDANSTARNMGGITNSLDASSRAATGRSNREYGDSRQSVINRFQQRAEEVRNAQRAWEEGEGATASDREFANRRKQTRNTLRELEKEGNSVLSRSANEQSEEAKLLKELLEETKSQAREEIKRDREGVESRLYEYERGRLTDLTPEEESRLLMQQEMLKGKGGEDDDIKNPRTMSILKEIVLGTLLAGGIQSLLSVPNRAMTTFASAQSEDHITAQLWRMVPFIGEGLAAANERHLREREARDVASNSLRGTTGKRSYFSAAGLGYDAGETMNIGTNLAKTRGFAGNVGGDTMDIIALSRAFNLDIGSLTSSSTLDKMGGGNAMSRVLSLLANTTVTDDFSKINTLLEIQNGFLEEQSQYLQNIDVKSSSQALGAMSLVFGDDKRLGARLQSINQGLRTPGNDYQQAINLAVLSGQNPSGSYYDLKSAEERGINEPGFLANTMKFYTGTYGKGELAMEAVRRRFGLSFSQGKTLFNAYESDPNRFDNIGLQDVFGSDLFTENRVKSLAQGNVSNLQADQAIIGDSFADGMMKGLGTVGRRVGLDIADEVRNLTKDSGLFRGIGNMIADGIKDVLSGKKGVENNLTKY